MVIPALRYGLFALDAVVGPGLLLGVEPAGWGEPWLAVVHGDGPAAGVDAVVVVVAEEAEVAD
jgi:hypothetical protein